MLNYLPNIPLVCRVKSFLNFPSAETFILDNPRLINVERGELGLRLNIRQRKSMSSRWRETR